MAKLKVTKETLRYDGCRDLPELPTLNPEDYSGYVMEGLRVGLITIEKASYLLHEENPENPHTLISKEGKDAPSRTSGWLNTQYDAKLLHSSQRNDNDQPLFSPGNLIRHMWEQHRNFSLRAWSIYNAIDSGDFSGALEKGISDSNYIKAAKLIRAEAPKSTKVFIIEILMTFPNTVFDCEGKPCFKHASESALKNLLKIKGQLGLSAGRKKYEDQEALNKKKPELVEKIKQTFSQE